jgi:hypothetical protein
MTATVDDLLRVFETIFDGDVEHAEPFALRVLDNGSRLDGDGCRVERYLPIGQRRDGDRWLAIQSTDDLINGYCGAGCLPSLMGELLEAIEKWRQAGGARPD